MSGDVNKKKKKKYRFFYYFVEINKGVNHWCIFDIPCLYLTKIDILILRDIKRYYDYDLLWFYNQ